MPANHTPTPWHVQPIGGQRYVEAQGPKLVCDMQADSCENPAEVAEMEANAAFIVKACNCHEELVEAAERVLSSSWDIADPDCPARMALESALAKAKAKGRP